MGIERGRGLASDRCVEGEDVEAKEAHHGQDVACRRPAVPDRKLAAGLARHGGGMGPADFEADFRSGVAQPHHQDRARLQLVRVEVVAGVQLDDGGLQLRGEARAFLAPGLQPVATTTLRASQRWPLEAATNRSASRHSRSTRMPFRTGRSKRGGVPFKVVRRARPWWGRTAVAGKRHPRQAVVLGRREDPERVPPLAPGVAGSRIRVQDQEFPVLLLR